MAVSAAPAILVFGKNGQVARELALLDGLGGYRMTFAGRDRCDLLVDNPAHFIRATNPSAVINASAYTAVDRAESETEAAFRLNSDVVGQMARACADIEIPFVHMSTDYVFDGTKASPYVETDERRPLSVYGASKMGGELAVEAAGGRSTILRTAWVISSFGSNFIKTMLRLAAERHDVSVVDDQWGRPTFAADIAVMAVRAAMFGVEGRTDLVGLFHIAGADDAVWADVADYVFERLRLLNDKSPNLARISTDAYPTPAKRPANSRLQTSKLEAAVGWTPRPWRDGVDKCLAILL